LQEENEKCLSRELRCKCASNALVSGCEQKYSVKNGVIMGRLIRKRGKIFLSGPAENLEFYTVGE
jgi:hypothetical protein